jgi:hypothetical protein
MANAALNYAQNCYGDAIVSKYCTRFVRQSLPFSVDRNATCPFDKSMCLYGDQGNIRLEAYIYSNDHLGINAPPETNFGMKIIEHCAPLVLDGHKVLRNVTLDNLTVPYALYFYGGRNKTSGAVTNHSYAYPYTPLSSRIYDNATSPDPDYTLS